jgi:hypothetical protein
MPKPKHHPLLPLGLAVVLVAFTALLSFVPTRTPPGPPKDPKEVITTQIPLSQLPVGMPAEDPELAKLRAEGYKIGKTIALRGTPQTLGLGCGLRRLHI